MANLNSSDARPNFQLRIWHLFYAVTFYAAGFAIAPGLIVPTTFWLVVAFFAARQPTRRESFGIWGRWVAISILGSCCLLMPVSRYPFAAAQRSVCGHNMRQIMLAMHSYESEHGSLPGAHVLDATGEPTHSWRVLILPFLAENDLYQRYSFDEPWDGPNNRKLAKFMPEVYRCPAHNHGDKTHYKLVTGAETVFVDDQEPKLDRVIDGTSSTAVLVEDPGNPVNWMKPDDVTIDEAIKLLSEPEASDVAHFRKEPFQYVYYGSSVGMLDGSVRHMHINLDAHETRKLFGSNNGVPGDDYGYRSGGIVVTRYGAIVSAWIYAALVLLPVVLTFFRRDRICGVVQDAASLKGESEDSVAAMYSFSEPERGE